ncbi:LLM class flavin-dependent oxidoreductase [Rhizosaccharibacter radicis]|uniref:LLM class flavin-dependent oxidoreductase n=1 Tax=Rhizosaccharibacter radicis TaxID=2782605 RepID=A0ABT1W172_9PROT|nr:LLM class flavin-dependent oxidoreductase [Acetobacteraceae bacterium KSS12]
MRNAGGDGRRRMHLCAFLFGTGHHVGSWRQPDAPLDNGTTLAHWLDCARIAERGLLDAIFLYDGAGLPPMSAEVMSRTGTATFFDPLVLLPALAVLTERIGLIATGNTTFDQPYYLARRFLSLDNLSGGRAGWNMVTGVNPNEALNFGKAMVPHADRYARAREFAQVVRRLWESWDDDAFLMDKASGRFFRPDAFHVLDHHGAHFDVRGPLCVPRSPQGHPVMIQAGGSEPGRALAAETAEMIYSVQGDLAEAQAFYADVKGRMPAFGRDPGTLKIMPGVYFIVGRTAGEAEDKFGALSERTDPAVSMERLRFCMGGHDMSRYDPDGPVPEDLETQSGTTHLRIMTAIARERKLTLRQLADEVAAGGYGHWSIRGSAEQVADQLQHRFEAGAADGFNLMPATYPGGLRDFVELVVPILQKRGLFRTAYEGRTLREHLGLPRPAVGGAQRTSAAADG